ncbi:alkaline phosphatase family protein [uncultured Roseovarius sp.]|uniref:alkaline phosphatase family protein n=1 Tax=uncultured Roseovarius sp. TaxID=293344 RepID=UPI002634551A|nr:alkaline phosphatase family protein [uncultured Roseovarius sp.]
MARSQNVLFILIDQLRADLLHGVLADHVDLPNLRALMAEAVTFRRHYSVVNPCGPSRASILTGQYAKNHRSVRNGTPLRHDTPNLAIEARKAGYQPLLFGYTDTTLDPRMHHPSDPAMHSYEQPMPGFDEIVEMRSGDSYPWRAYLAGKGYDLPDYDRFYVPNAAQDQPRTLTDPAFYKAEDSDTAFLTDRCLDHLRVQQGQSWFTHLTYIRPHPPLVAPTPYNRMYDPANLPLPRQSGDAPHPFHEISKQRVTPRDFVQGFDDLEATEETIQSLRAIYLGLASEVDHHIGRVIRYLKETGQYDDTLLIVGADHGEMLGDHNSWGKMTFYDAAYHVPLIIRDPRNTAQHGNSVSAFTESVDVMPTLLDWIGEPTPTSVNGHSLMPFLQGENPKGWRGESYSDLDFGDPLTLTIWQNELGLSEAEASMSILRTDRLTLVHFAGNLPPVLFDHQAEGELRNVAADPKYASDLLAMTQKLLSHRMRHPDTTLSKTMITDAGPVTGR